MTRYNVVRNEEDIQEQFEMAAENVVSKRDYAMGVLKTLMWLFGTTDKKPLVKGENNIVYRSKDE